MIIILISRLEDMDFPKYKGNSKDNITENKNQISTHIYDKNMYKIDLNQMRNLHVHNKLTNGYIQTYFEKLEEHLIDHIQNSSYVIGCVAWLTNSGILYALESRTGIKIIINKEEYLNQEMEIGKKFFYRCLRGQYNEIPDLFCHNCHCCDKNITNCDKFVRLFGELDTK